MKTVEEKISEIKTAILNAEKESVFECYDEDEDMDICREALVLTIEENEPLLDENKKKIVLHNNDIKKIIATICAEQNISYDEITGPSFFERHTFHVYFEGYHFGISY